MGRGKISKLKIKKEKKTERQLSMENCLNNMNKNIL